MSVAAIIVIGIVGLLCLVICFGVLAIGVWSLRAVPMAPPPPMIAPVPKVEAAPLESSDELPAKQMPDKPPVEKPAEQH